MCICTDGAMTDKKLDEPGRECAMLRVRMAARAVTRHYEAHLAPTGLTGAQFSLLAALKADPGFSATELAERLAIDRTTMVRNLDVLVRSGLLVSAQDGRAKRKTLSKNGEKILARALPLWRKAQDELVGKLGDAGWSEARKSLRALREAV
jgi:DNA-binding MarR family transcriptional regulator